VTLANLKGKGAEASYCYRFADQPARIVGSAATLSLGL
jgi:hypothetical protein